MGFFKGLFGQSGKESSTHIAPKTEARFSLNSIYDIGMAFSVLVSCIAVADSENQYMFIVDCDPEKKTTSLYAGGNKIEEMICQKGITANNLKMLGLSGDVIEFFLTLPFQTGKGITMQYEGMIDVVRMKSAMEQGIGIAKWRPEYCQIKDYTVPNSDRLHIDMTVVND